MPTNWAHLRNIVGSCLMFVVVLMLTAGAFPRSNSIYFIALLAAIAYFMRGMSFTSLAEHLEELRHHSILQDMNDALQSRRISAIITPADIALTAAGNVRMDYWVDTMVGDYPSRFRVLVELSEQHDRSWLNLYGLERRAVMTPDRMLPALLVSNGMGLPCTVSYGPIESPYDTIV